MNWLYLVYFLIVAAIWMAGLCVLSLIAWGVYLLWRLVTKQKMRLT